MIKEKLLKIQTELKAPKSQYNNFGKYYFRNCEDILKAVKPLAKKYKAVLTVTDEICLIGERYYVKAIAKLKDIEDETEEICIAYAREEQSKKGMDEAQVTGATSSYARKYALNGLFGIDDTKDMDSNEYPREDENKSKVVIPKVKKVEDAKKLLTQISTKEVVELRQKLVDEKISIEKIQEVLKEYGYKKVAEIEMDKKEEIVNKLFRKE